MKRDYLLVFIIVCGLGAAALLTHLGDRQRVDVTTQFAEEPLYLNGPAMKRLTLSFNGVAADWYWMRCLQYVGRKIVHYEDTHDGNFNLADLSELDLRLLPSLLRMATTLDPQFMEPYAFAAVVLPDIDENEAIALLNAGISHNPNTWRLYQYLGYIYWQRRDYLKSSETYAAGAALPDAPVWMTAMSARMKAEGGAGQAAREMYFRLAEASDDPNVKQMVEKQVMRLDSVEERTKIRGVLSDFTTRSGRCASSWREVSLALRNAGLHIDNTGAPLDPSGTPYDLIKNGCDVDLNNNTQVPRR